jgi:hypothetical protein
MSTMLIADEKFCRVYRGLHLVERAGSCLAEVWDYPAGWENGIDSALRSFVQALRTANIKAYNERYRENEPVRILSFTPRPPFNAIDLIKALHSIRYNIDDQNVKGCAKRLERLINYLMERYIRDLPEYQESDAW